MKQIDLLPENIPAILKENLKNPDVIFVFATDTVMNSWIDWIVTHADISGFDAVPLERFTAWDTFKNDYLSSSQKGKTAIPTLLRQLFIEDLILKNAAKPKEERMQVLINPNDEYAASAKSFADWIGKILKSLNLWKNRFEKYKADYGKPDDEDADFDFLYAEYKNFLDKNDFFEPSWIEKIEFEEKNKKFLIIFPETMQDFNEYKEVFDFTDCITSFVVPKNLPLPEVFLYSDSRKELRTVMLQIVDLVHNKKCCDWSEIALNIPDIDLYRPYIQREFELYNIPYVIKAGISLTKNCAGRIFREIYDCYNSNYTFDSVRALLLDECIPWKEEFVKIKEDLIREGNIMRCICSPFETNIWLSAFATKINRLNNPEDAEKKAYYEQLKAFFMKLQKHVGNFFDSENSTFANIKKSWLEFKYTFLKDEKDFLEESNNILSRCIKELDEIIKIEKDYSSLNLHASNPFDFYLTILDGKTYTPQTTKTGVNIYKYKLAAAANFKFQFVIDSSQKNLEIQNQRLGFLNARKREKLHLVEEDSAFNSTQALINLYAKKTETADENFVHFSAATNSFSGFAIPHSYLKYIKNNPNLPDLDSQDYILNEKLFFQGKSEELSAISENQEQMFKNWTQCRLESETDLDTYQKNQYNEKILQLINRKKDSQNGKLSISARGDLEKFFPCPKKWLLSSVLKFSDDTLDTDLMKNTEMGTLHHKILEIVLTDFMEKPLFCYDKEKNCFLKVENGAFVDCTAEFEQKVLEACKKAVKMVEDFRDAPLVVRTLEDQVAGTKKTIINFFQTFLIPYEEGGFGGTSVFGLEKKVFAEYENYNYKGYVDCILKTQEGDLIIIDFKNTDTSIPKAKEIIIDENSGLLGDFQMPLYYEMVTKDTKNDVIKAQFASIKDNTKRNAFNESSTKSNKDKTLDEFIQKAVIPAGEYADLFTQKVQELNFTPTQSENEQDRQNVKPYDVCSKCSFKTFCRTTYNVGSRKIEKKGAYEND